MEDVLIQSSGEEAESGLEHLLPEFDSHLLSIAGWWKDHAVDRERGGFHGEVSVHNVPRAQADKGVVLNARILWFFSEVSLYLERNGRDATDYRALAERACNYLLDHFDDREHGGAFWALDYRGRMTESRKQTYAQAFCIYALAGYHRLTGCGRALEKAMAYFHLVETHCVDRERGGYLEAVARDWSAVSDYRLSEKDLNAPKTMNNHLHVLEALTGLCRVHPVGEVRAALHNSIVWFCEKIIDAQSGHLRLFLDADWRDISPGYSYGHDIEGSWLLMEALEMLGDRQLLRQYEPLARALGESCLREGVGSMGQLLDHFDFEIRSRCVDAEWWVQAEALVGFLNLWQMTGDGRYRTAFENVWKFIKAFQVDREGGEWLYHASLVTAVRADQRYKLGFWKGPYHNGRAMMEAYRRIERLQMKKEKQPGRAESREPLD
ncbi:AGE family epimerase/isomerase [Microbulbifer litoralis]|uniref:AGE family epimerase/isomerase n=1 Tax=Microbulbifer litoralis TaxID=2933965 RepID=UPI0020277F42|nr:AGE family epimerase/isomerase [Microbulbifer sp. GX H0434]